MKLIKMGVEQVVKGVRDGTIGIEEVRRAYQMRVLDVAVEANYIAEICTTSDMITGRSNVEKVKPEYSLYGVTFSVADWIDMNGFDSTCGYANRCVKPSSEDAVVIRALRDNLMATPLFRSSVN